MLKVKENHKRGDKMKTKEQIIDVEKCVEKCVEGYKDFSYAYTYCPFCYEKNYLTYDNKWGEGAERKVCIHFETTNAEKFLKELNLLFNYDCCKFKKRIKELKELKAKAYFIHNTVAFEEKVKQAGFETVEFDFNSFQLDFYRDRFFACQDLLAEQVSKWGQRGHILYITCRTDVYQKDIYVFKLYQIFNTTLGRKICDCLVVKVNENNEII